MGSMVAQHRLILGNSRALSEGVRLMSPALPGKGASLKRMSVGCQGLRVGVPPFLPLVLLVFWRLWSRCPLAVAMLGGRTAGSLRVCKMGQEWKYPARIACSHVLRAGLKQTAWRNWSNSRWDLASMAAWLLAVPLCVGAIGSGALRKGVTAASSLAICVCQGLVVGVGACAHCSGAGAHCRGSLQSPWRSLSPWRMGWPSLEMITSVGVKWAWHPLSQRAPMEMRELDARSGNRWARCLGSWGTAQFR